MDSVDNIIDDYERISESILSCMHRPNLFDNSCRDHITTDKISLPIYLYLLKFILTLLIHYRCIESKLNV